MDLKGLFSEKRSIMANERRTQTRERLTLFDELYFSGTLESGVVVSGKIINITPTGVAIEVPESSEVSVAQKITDIKISIKNNQVGTYPHGIIIYSSPVSFRKRIGVQLESEPQESRSIDSRTRERIEVSDASALTATAKHPFRYDDQIIFKVKDLSLDGAKLTTSFRNRTILRGLEIKDLEFHLPLIQSVKADARVVSMKVDRKNVKLEVGILFSKISDEFASSFVKLLIHHGNIKSKDIVKDLRSAGFFVKNLKSHVDYSLVWDEREYGLVLKLRKDAYTRSGKINPNTSIDSFKDQYDARSHIFVARVRGEVVGSVRVTFCYTPHDRFELEESITLPNFIDRMKTIEVSRLCIDGRYENTDVILGLIERCMEVGVKSSITHVVTSCTEAMVDYYSKIAFFRSGDSFNLKTLENIPHYLLIHDMRSSLTGHRMNPVYWKLAYGNVLIFLKNLGWGTQFELPFWKKLILGILYPLSRKKVKNILLKNQSIHAERSKKN